MKWLRRWSRPDRGWPNYLPGGRIRTSTVTLAIVFVALFWLHQTYEPPPSLTEPSGTQVVPPGFVPDPNYTWVPRTNVRRPREPLTTTTTPTTTPTTTSPTETVSPLGPDGQTTGPTSPGEATSPAPGELPAPTATTEAPQTTTPRSSP